MPAINLPGVTRRQFNTLEDLYDYYNQHLFGSQLPACLINMSRKNRSAGFFKKNAWHDRQGAYVHEISLNPDTFSLGEKYWHATLVHEMCHLWQEVLGTPPRKCYHDKEWAEKMQEVGLMPSHTGLPGGKTTGQSMCDYVISGGRFEQVFSTIEKNKELQKLALPFLCTSEKAELPTEDQGEGGGEEPLAEETKSGIRVKYSCLCGTNVWGKQGLRLLCLDCQVEFSVHE